MASVWLTYAWKDNEDGDVDYVAQELVQAGLVVKLDRWNLRAGIRLWQQIERFIQDPVLPDAWILYATQNSLGSEACKEEFYYALDRALHSRGEAFPVIALLPATVDSSLLPAGLRIRVCVSLANRGWKEQIKAAAERRTPMLGRDSVPPYFMKVHPYRAGEGLKYVIEVRPRAGTWSPFIAAIPRSEKLQVNPRIKHGPSGRIPRSAALYDYLEAESPDRLWWLMTAKNEATPTQSYYVHCDRLPSSLLFGIKGGQPQYVVELTN